jgi:hypothetical protein
VDTHRGECPGKNIAARCSHPTAYGEKNIFQVTDQGGVAIHQDAEIGHHGRFAAGKESTDLPDLIEFKPADFQGRIDLEVIEM